MSELGDNVALAFKTCNEQRARIAELEEQLATAQERLQRIADWCDAYPLEQFPEPDMSMVSELLGSKLLSELSAYNYRHVVNGMRAIAKGGA